MMVTMITMTMAMMVMLFIVIDDDDDDNVPAAAAACKPVCPKSGCGSFFPPNSRHNCTRSACP